MNYLVQDYLSESAQRFPDNIFLKDPSTSVTFKETDILTNRLANLLVASGLKRHDRVCFFLRRSTDAFKALFGILKADGLYIGINPKTPADRVRQIFNDSQCRYVIANKDSYDLLAGILKEMPPGIRVILLSSKKDVQVKGANDLLDLVDIERASAHKRVYENIDIDLAYILYTSGSTGTPKGVMITHRNVMDYTEWASDYFHIGPQDRIANTSGLYFDLSVFDIYCAAKCGACIYVIPDSALPFPKKITDLIDQEKLTIWNSVPSLMTYMAKVGALHEDRCQSLQKIVFCGEVMPTRTMMEWMKTYPGKMFVNLYGPAETTCESMVYHIEACPTDPEVPLPIGKACANTEVFTLKEDMTLAGPGEEGELYIRGSSNGMGYLNDPQKTESKFVLSPFNKFYPERIYATGDIARLRPDGNYDFVGRKDFQIKYMGYRIELGEIESVLNSLNYVVESAAITSGSPEGEDNKIVAFVCLNTPKETAEIKEAMTKKLPHYMVPRKIVVLDAMPKNLHGKIDRTALRKHLA
jgi:amino acid adenylation domain-containing protein